MHFKYPWISSTTAKSTNVRMHIFHFIIHPALCAWLAYIIYEISWYAYKKLNQIFMYTLLKIETIRVNAEFSKQKWLCIFVNHFLFSLDFSLCSLFCLLSVHSRVLVSFSNNILWQFELTGFSIEHPYTSTYTM